MNLSHTKNAPFPKSKVYWRYVSYFWWSASCHYQQRWLVVINFNQHFQCSNLTRRICRSFSLFWHRMIFPLHLHVVCDFTRYKCWTTQIGSRPFKHLITVISRQKYKKTKRPKNKKKIKKIEKRKRPKMAVLQYFSYVRRVHNAW